MVIIMNVFKRLIYSVIFTLSIIYILSFTSNSYAITTLKYSEVNFNKYPGYKTLIDNLTTSYSNWNFVFYKTGLNWNDVIKGEYKGHGSSPSNLSPAKNANYDMDWICPTCGTKTYDSGSWYCASEDAIEYMMDPRNSINSSDVFQFQSLSSTTYTKSALEKMVKGTFLDSTACIDAVIQASTDNKVSPYHIISRILQEQGTSGTALTSGKEYIGTDGVKYKGFYNVFNIGATGNGESTIITNGLKRAKSEGWTTLAKSIIGGTKFISTNYIARGQSTLYFQKFNTVTPTYYSHQYMQNILAAQTEGTTMRNAYSSANILNSKFEFIIPLYENIPSTACPRPLISSNQYKDNITTKLNTITIGNNSTGNYIKGTVTITETRNGKAKTPTQTPTITLKSQDSTIKKASVSLVSGSNYSFTIYIDGLVNGQTAYLETSLTNSKNIGTSKTQNIKTSLSDYLGTTSNGDPISYSNTSGYLILQLGASSENDIDAKLSSISIR